MQFAPKFNHDYVGDTSGAAAKVINSSAMNLHSGSRGTSKFFSGGKAKDIYDDKQCLLSFPPNLKQDPAKKINNITIPIISSHITLQNTHNMTSAKPLDSFLPSNLFSVDPLAPIDPAERPPDHPPNQGQADPSHWDPFSIGGATWSYRPSSMDSGGSIGQRTLADNHKRQLSDLSTVSQLSFGSKFDDWANYLPTTGTHTGAVPAPTIQTVPMWDPRASFSSTGSGMNVDAFVSNGHGFFFEDHRESVGNTSIISNAKGSPKTIESPLKYTSSHRSNEISPQSSPPSPTGPTLDLKTYFGTPAPERLNINKALSYFRRSLGDNLPTFNVMQHELSRLRFYLVCFKETRLDLFCASRDHTKQDYSKGDIVLVQADRGVDLGCVVNSNLTLEEARVFKTKQNSDQRANGGKTSDEVRLAGLELPREIIRLAEPSDVDEFPEKDVQERAATKVCQEKVIEYGLNLMVEDCEYQWDKNKLTFYYQSNQRVDFRDLIRELFRLYKARIWMCKTSSLYKGIT